MDFKRLLSELNLNHKDSVVIGSGILNVLNIRISNDIDVVVSEKTYKILSRNNRFKKSQNHGHEILTDKHFEIGTKWEVLGKNQTIDDLIRESIVIDKVRYIALTFLLTVKESWLKENDIRQKDIDDVKLIKNYLAKYSI